MPQETNLNVTPYFDDFDDKKNYYKVLFKPGYPIQARELTTLQSILQNQIEKFGNHVFKEGSRVLGGEIVYDNYYEGIQVETSYLGLSVETYLNNLVGKYIIGQDSKVKAKVEYILPATESPTKNTIIYISYRDSNIKNTREFNSGEVLLSDQNIPYVTGGVTSIQAGQGICRTISANAPVIGSSIHIASGVYFIRGYFVNIDEETLILDPTSSNVNYSVGLKVYEDIVTFDDDESLADNSQGFSNYAAPGADRFALKVKLSKYLLSENQDEGYIELVKIRNGQPDKVSNTPEYNELAKEFARRTYDESGDYYVTPFTVTVNESLDNLKGNKGIFKEGQSTYGNRTASESLGVYKVSPGKAYIRGFEVDIPSPTFIDFEKPRKTKTLVNQGIIYNTGATFKLNRVHGTPTLGISTNYTLSLRSERIGTDNNIAPGKEIGIARVYDFALESGTYNVLNQNTNEWDITLFDVQPYAELTLNDSINLQVPTFIKGSSSGATAFLRNSVSNSANLTVYNVSGKFLKGERLSFDGVQNNRIITSIKSYDVNDFKSVYGIVGTGSTFSGDVIQSVKAFVGPVNITAYAGISTVTSSDFIFNKKTVENDIVSFSTPGDEAPTYAKVVSVGEKSLTITQVTPVSEVCASSLPTLSNLTVSDFKILTSNLRTSTDNTLYTVFPHDKIASTNLQKSELIIRRQKTITISRNTSETIVLADDERFLPFDEERYALIYDDGTTEPLVDYQFYVTLGGQSLRLDGLSLTSGTAKLTYTIKKLNVSAKIKNRNRVNTIVVDKSKYNFSGIGQTTINDGLQFGNYPYGTRVHDEEISLCYPDVVKLLGVFESTTTGDPQLPSAILGLGNVNNGSIILGEEFVGDRSNCVAIVVERTVGSSSGVDYISLNSSDFIPGETVRFKESGIIATVNSLKGGNSANITNNYKLDNGQKDTFYDYGKIIRKSTSREPRKKLKIVFESTDFSPTDPGSIVTVDSYKQFDYCDIPSINNLKNYNILDLRPRVSNYIVQEGAPSPFESLSNDFVNVYNENLPILASDEDIILDYSYYLPRIDKIILSKEGKFQLLIGNPAEKPQAPLNLTESLDIATITLPAYLCSDEKTTLSLSHHKRYRMSDIKLLEDRIKNLEFYTTLSLLETETANFTIKDANGLDRFKSGFFVDNFTTLISQKLTNVTKNSIEVENSQLRPSVHTTSIDLILGHTDQNGTINFNNEDFDYKSNQSIVGKNVKKSVGTVGKGVLTLDYSETVEFSQPYATRVENVTPYLVTFYGGICDINPSSDIWMQPLVLDPINLGIKEQIKETLNLNLESEPDPNTGWAPMIFGSWETSWTSISAPKEFSRGEKYQLDGKWYQDVVYATDKTGTKSRVGTSSRITYTDTPVSYGNNLVSIDIATYCRCRNIEIISRKLKPFTQMYAFFDGQDVSRFMVPKLVEIEMESGVFQIGETVETDTSSSSLSDAFIRFRLCQPNHRAGRYDSPTSTYGINPYDRSQNIPVSYSASSNILNIDTFLLAEQGIGNFYGYISSGMRLIGKNSGAIAKVKNVRLVTDLYGSIMCSLFIPNSLVPSNPRFRTGRKLFRLTSLKSNSTLPGLLNSLTETSFYSQGTITTTQETIGTLRNITKELGTLIQSDPTSTTDFSQPVRVEIPAPPEPPPPLPFPQPQPEPSPEPIPDPAPAPVPPPTPAPEPSPQPGPDPVPGPTPVIEPTPSPGPTPSTTTTKQCRLYSRPGTYTLTVPDGVTSIEVSGVGGGGGGGYGRDQKQGAGGGGGGVSSQILTVTPGEVLTVVVGAGGRGATSEIKAEDGQPSYILNKNILAKGGLGGSSISKGSGGETSGGGGKGEDGRYDENDSDKGGHGGGAGLIGGGNSGHPPYRNCASKTGGPGGNGIRFSDAAVGGDSGSVPDCGNGSGGKGGKYGGGGGGGCDGNSGGNGAEGAFLLCWQEQTTRNGINQGGGGVELVKMDPLAQSFTIAAPEGRFVTAVDIFLQSKDDTLPLIVELRPMSLGVPTGEIYPFSQVVLYPDDIKVSEDGSVATRVQFEAPVYLKGNTEHALVLKSDSTDYYAWISRLGEVDITTASLPESGRIIISNQPDISQIGVLFKSQNASTWTASQYEDLKFTVYSAVFTSSGNVSFFSPDLTENNGQISILNNNPLEISSKKIKVSISSTLSDPNFKLGYTIIQKGTGATGNYVGAAGSVSNISITNSGIGYTPSNGTSFVYENVILANSTSSGKNATADITIGRQTLPDGSFNDGVAIAATIRNGGYGYQKGDVLSVNQLGNLTLGRNLLLTVNDITSYNQLIIDNVQGEFLVGAGYTLRYPNPNNAGINTNLNYGYSPDVHVEDIEVLTDGLHIKVNHPNHGMHSPINTVIISNVQSDISPTKLTADLSATSTGSITLENASGFEVFENVGIGTTNPGYALINNEIIAYTGISNGNQLTGVVRGIDNTTSQRYFTNTLVYKYELDGVSLRRINKTHQLQDASVLNPIGLDYYYLKINTSDVNQGLIRTPSSEYGSLHFSDSKSTGGAFVRATKNIQFEIIKPNIQVMTLPNTSVVSDMRTVSATSVGGVEPSFVDQGYERVDFNVDNYMTSSRLICSKINESTKLFSQPAKKSLEIRAYLSTQNNRLSPVIDLDRVGAILVSNRVNSPITDYINDSRPSTLNKDPIGFSYVTKPISLEVAATSLRVYVAAYINRNSDLRAFYAILKDPSESPIYYPFPGYANRIASGEVIDINQSDGTPDKFVPPNDIFGNGNTPNYFKDYEFSIDNLAAFRYFSIKLVATSTIQVYPPKLRDLRVIALA